MPFVTISHPTGVDGGAVSRGVQKALIDTFEVSPDDFFQVVTEHAAGSIVRPESYLGIQYTDRLTIVEITANDTRTVEQKKRLYRAIADNLARDAKLRTDDVFIKLVEVRKENWSFGRGEAQYA